MLTSSASTSFSEGICHLIAQREITEALDACDAVLRAGADPLALVHARWQCFMLLGDFPNAWRESDRIIQSHPPASDSHLPRHLRRVWNGVPLDGKRVLVRCYHGLGDTIQFCRFLPLLKKCAAQVKVQCQPSLVPLLESMVLPGELVLLDEGPEPAFDCEIDIMELPHIFRTAVTTIPSAVPYLRVNPELIQKFRRICDCVGLKVGLVWSSGNWDTNRNIALNELDPLCEVPGITFFCLQRGSATAHANNGAKFRFQYAEPEEGTLLDTAALISNLDLVITVDTMVAHLAGALGKPTWLLLPFCADWRWMLHRSDSPWYPTMKIIRQTRARNWSTVIAQIKSAFTL